MKLFNKLNGFSRPMFQTLGGILVCVSCGLMPAHALADEHSDFFLAVTNNDSNWVIKLLNRGLSPNIKEASRGDTALMLALRENAMDVFTLLVNFSKTNIEAKSDNGDTALMIAAYLRNQSAVQALLDHDAEVNNPGWTALHYAAAAGDVEIIKLLLDKSAYIDAESPNKTTPLMMAARAGQFSSVKLLVEEGADGTLKNEQGLDAVEFARRSDRKDIADWLAARQKPADKQSSKAASGFGST